MISERKCPKSFLLLVLAYRLIQPIQYTALKLLDSQISERGEPHDRTKQVHDRGSSTCTDKLSSIAEAGSWLLSESATIFGVELASKAMRSARAASAAATSSLERSMSDQRARQHIQRGDANPVNEKSAPTRTASLSSNQCEYLSSMSMVVARRKRMEKRIWSSFDFGQIPCESGKEPTRSQDRTLEAES